MNQSIIVGLLCAIFFGSTSPLQAAAQPWADEFDLQLRMSFREQEGSPEKPYTVALSYLITSFVDRQRLTGSRADQPGAPSRHGSDVDAMEAFTRLAPLVAAWLSSGRDREIVDLRGRRIDLLGWLRDGIVAGTSPTSEGYWGTIAPLGQGIVEAADVARAMWIARDLLMPQFSAGERQNVATWLGQLNSVRVPDNNWHLYPVLVHEILVSLGFPNDGEAARQHFARFQDFRLGEGWYSDGPDRDNVDWYNVWGIHYELWWIRKISPGYGGQRLSQDLENFAKIAPFMIGAQGIPIMGRSICYRLAAPTAVVTAAMEGPDGYPRTDPGLARHALDVVWRYFVRHGAFSDGTITQGYCGTDLRVLDNYSGPSSCLWSLRPLVIAFMAPSKSSFWTAPAVPLPVEQKSYSIDVAPIRWTVSGDHDTGDVRLTRLGLTLDGPVPKDTLQSFSWWRRAISTVLWFRPYRPENHKAKYDLPVYSSATPFCGC